MEQRTSRYIPNAAERHRCRRLLAAMLLFLVMAVQGVAAQGIGGSLQSFANSSRNNSGSQQQRTERRNTEPEIEYPLLNGIEVGVDILGPATKLLGSDSYSVEALANLDIKHRLLPVDGLQLCRPPEADGRQLHHTPYRLHSGHQPDSQFRWNREHQDISQTPLNGTAAVGCWQQCSCSLSWPCKAWRRRA